MNYSGIILHDSANGPGWRITLFVSGCQHNCLNCQNAEAQDYEYGEPYTDKTKHTILEALKRPEIQGLTLSGGDPLCQDKKGTDQLTTLCQVAHYVQKDVWLWTGYTWEQIFAFLTPEQKKLASSCDIIVDGQFVENKKDLSLAWRGSSNQRIINVQASLSSNQIVLEDKYYEHQHPFLHP